MRIAFFLGRIHHAHKLLSVASALQKSGAEINIVVADNSVNIDPPTEYLHKFGINVFYHAKDYVGYTEGLEEMLDFAWVKDDMLKYFPPFWLMASYREAVECIAGFNGYFDDRKPDAVFALHENNFWARILFYNAQKKGIATYSLQEGIILEREEEALQKYSTGTQYTDVLFSWSKHDKDFYSDTARIVPTGPSHMDRWVTLSKDQTQRDGFKTGFRGQAGVSSSKLLVFAPPRLDLYAGDFGKAANALAKWTMNRNIGMVVKLHPFQNGVEQVKELMNRFSHVQVAADSDSLQFVMAADVLVTQTSTIAVEAAILGVPVVELDIDYIGLDQTIHQHGGATLIEGNNLDVIAGVMNDVANMSQKDFVSEYFSLADGQSTKRIVDYVMAGLWVK